jgi:predicted nucleic acid-binding protein
MKLIVNTNRIIAALIKDSVSRKLIFNSSLELLLIPSSETEIKKWLPMVLEKARITEEEFFMIYTKLKEKMTLLPDELVQLYMTEAKKIMDAVDSADTPFIAAALATESDIWSDDQHFEKQNTIKIWKTKDLIQFLQ